MHSFALSLVSFTNPLASVLQVRCGTCLTQTQSPVDVQIYVYKKLIRTGPRQSGLTIRVFNEEENTELTKHKPVLFVHFQGTHLNSTHVC